VKTPFKIELALQRISGAVQPYPKAALFELYDEGYRTPFELLLACLISVRTRDEVTLICARRLFEKVRTPQAVLQLTEDQIDALIRASTFHRAKARQFLVISAIAVNQYQGEIPCDYSMLTSLKGVGPKCANLVLGIACGESKISVDIHVHRVTNRWGYVHTTSPEKTMLSLEKILPKKYWVEINRLLVPFGKHICTGLLPKCSTCPVLEMCAQVGVAKHR